MEFRKAILMLKKLWSLGNSYIDARAPWNLLKTDREEAAMVLGTCINLVRVFAVASEPVIPFAAAKVFDALHMSPEERKVSFLEAVKLDALEPGRAFTVPEMLFARVQDADVTALEERFRGKPDK